MVIKRSAGQEIQALVAELGADDEVRREAAIARLAVIGTRAVDRILAILAAPSTTPRTAVSALRALESAGDVRALAPALTLLASPNAEIGAAAVGVLRSFLHSKHGTEVLDRLVACSLDRDCPDATRLAALDALVDTGGRVVGPLWDRLRDDPSLAVRQRAARETGGLDPIAEIEAAGSGVLPDDPERLRLLVRKTAATAPLATLHRLIDVLKTREGKERSRAAKGSWLAVRGEVHLALADRQSRVALYDLRDAFATSAGPLAASFVAALNAIGDSASLEAIAAAYARAAAAGASEWTEQLAAAFRAVVARERLGPRHAIMKKIEKKWPAAKALIDTKRSQ